MANSDTLLVRVSCNTEEMLKSLKRAENSLNNFRETAESVSGYVHSWGVQMQTIGLAFHGFEKTFSWIKTAVNQFMAFGDQLDKMSLRSGVAAADLSALKFAAEQCGGSIEDIGNGFRDLNKNLSLAESGDAANLKRLEELDLSPAILSGMTMKEKFLEVAEALSNLDSESKKVELSMALFGEAGNKLLPMLKSGKVGIEELMAEAERLGITMGEDSVSDAAAMTDEINRLKSSLSSLTRQGIAAVAQPLIEMAEYFRSWVETITIAVKNNQWLVQTLLALGKGFLVFRGSLIVGSLAMTSFHRVLQFGHNEIQKYRVQCALARMQLAGMPAACQTTSIALLGLQGRVFMLAQSLKALLLSNPIGWITLAAFGFYQLGSAILGAKAELQDFEEEKQKAAEEAEQESAAIATKIDRLKELSAVEERTRSEQKEMETLLRHLAAAGLDVNKIYDEQTGKLSDLAEGYENLKKSAKWKEAEALKAANAEIMRNLQINGQNITAKGEERSVSLLGTLFGWENKEQMKELEEMEQKGKDFVEKYQANLQKIQELESQATQDDENDKRILREREEKKKLLEESQKTNVTVDNAILQASFADDRAKELYENEQKYAKLRADLETSLAALDVQRDSEGKLSEELQKKYDAYQEFYGKLGDLEYQAMVGIHEKYAAKEQEAIRRELEKTEAAARKKEEEARKAREENTKRLIDLQNQLMDASLTASQRELQAIQKINAELEERLRKENNLTEAQRQSVEEALRKNRDRETAFVDSKLDPAQANFVSRMDQLQRELAASREEYLKALERSGFQEDTEDVQMAKSKMESSEKAIQSMTLQGRQSQVEKLQVEFQTKSDELANATDTNERLRLTDELERLRQELESARDSVWTLQDSAAQRQIQESKNLLEKEETQGEFAVSSNGTFSAYGLDSVAGVDIPKQSLDQLKKICQTVLSIHSQKTEEGFVI
ncbi:MAG: hypothetical protein Q4D62_14200 [Planctomycetia bacterium]|nr:hypothetical protein [Planctomycetia bacterium]